MIPNDLRSVTTIDRTVHDPLRLLIMAYLSLVQSADFKFLQQQLQLTQGNLSQHMSKLEDAGYIVVDKAIINKKTRTSYHLTDVGRQALHAYRRSMTQLLETLGDDV